MKMRSNEKIICREWKWEVGVGGRSRCRGRGRGRGGEGGRIENKGAKAGTVIVTVKAVFPNFYLHTTLNTVLYWSSNPHVVISQMIFKSRFSIVLLAVFMSFHYSISLSLYFHCSYITQNQNVTSCELLTHIFVRLSGDPQKNPRDYWTEPLS